MNYLKKVFVSDWRNYKIEVEECNIDLEDRKDTSYYYILYKNVDLYFKDGSFYDSCWDVIEKSTHFKTLDSCIENSFLSLYNIEEEERLYNQISFFEYNKWKDNFWKLSYESDRKNLNEYEAHYYFVNNNGTCRLCIYKNENNKFQYQLETNFLTKIINSKEFDSKEEAYKHSIKARKDIFYILRFKNRVQNFNLKCEFELDNEKYKDRFINTLSSNNFSCYKDIEDALITEFQEEITEILNKEAKKIVDDLYVKGLCVSFDELGNDKEHDPFTFLISTLIGKIVFFNKDKIIDMFIKINSEKKNVDD